MNVKVTTGVTVENSQWFTESLSKRLPRKPAEVASLETTIGQLPYFKGKGCDACGGTGLKGRQGLYEIMLFDDEMRDMIVNHASTQQLRMESKKRGMRTLRQCGLMSIYDGITTIEEVVRETIMEEE